MLMNTTDSSTNSIASGIRSKNDAPRIEPAEKAMRMNNIRCNVFSLKERAKIPPNEKRLTIIVAVTILKSGVILGSSIAD